MSFEEIETNGRYPDFIIVGAMKSGTTSLHNILSSHPGIYIPEQEIHFFDIDDFIQHPDFFLYSSGKWYYPQLQQELEKYLSWYKSFFSTAKDVQIIGEDSTTYLASSNAPKRIVNLIPDVKIIIMLRDPASRTYSHYWHLLRTGRAIYNFEDSLRLMPGTLIQRSLYKKQVENYLNYFSRQNINFILFEEFIQKIQKTVDDACNFLDLSPNSINIDQFNTHYNPARIPKFPTIQIWRNRLFKNFTHPSYSEHLIDYPDEGKSTSKSITSFIDRLHGRINSQKKDKPPAMRSETRQFLNEYFFLENDGLDKLIGKDINTVWYLD